jgi:hypothetical protein
MITPILDTIVNDDIREFAKVLVEGLPPYVWEVGASSTGKYHPAYSLGLGGLIGCVLIGLGYIVAAPGIVFSILGKRSIKYRDKANKGLVLSIIGTVVGFIIYFLFFFIIGLIAGLEGDPYMYY